MNSRIRKYLRPCCFFMGIFILASLALQTVYSDTKKESVKVLLLPFLSFGPIMIAADEGYFSEQGIEVELVRMDRGSKAVPLLIRGELDVWGGGIGVGFLNAVAKGEQIKAVADKGFIDPAGCTYVAFMTRKDLVENGELDSPKKMKGRKVSVKPGTFRNYYLYRALSLGGLDEKDIETLVIPDPVVSESLEKGVIDIHPTGEPWVTRITASGAGVPWLPAEEVVPDFQLAFIAFSHRLLEENPDLGRRFMVAYLKAIRQYNGGKTGRNLEILSKYTGLSEDFLKKACWPPLRDDGSLNFKSMDGFQGWAVESGYLDGKVSEDQLWDPRFIDHANQMLGSATP